MGVFSNLDIKKELQPGLNAVDEALRDPQKHCLFFFFFFQYRFLCFAFSIACALFVLPHNLTWEFQDLHCILVSDVQ